MSRHQWLSYIDADGNVVTSELEMTAVLRCAASLADKEGMHHTAKRLRNDADRIAELYTERGQVAVVVR